MDIVLCQQAATDLLGVFSFQMWSAVTKPARGKTDIVVRRIAVEVDEENPEGFIENTYPDEYIFDYKNPRMSVLIMQAIGNEEMEKKCNFVLIKSFFNDRLNKMVKNETNDRLISLASTALELELSLSTTSFDMAEVPDYAIAAFEDVTYGAKIILLAADPVYMGFAHTKFELVTEDYDRFFDTDGYWPGQDRECPQYFKDMALALKQNKQLLAGLSTYLMTFKTAKELGPEMKKATLALTNNTASLDNIDAMIKDWHAQWSKKELMPTGSDKDFKTALRKQLDDYVATAAKHKASGTEADLEIFETMQKIVSVLDPAGVDAELQNASKEAKTNTTANAALRKRSGLQQALEAFVNDQDKIPDIIAALDATENEHLPADLKGLLEAAKAAAIAWVVTMITEDDINNLTLGKLVKIRNVVKLLGAALQKVAATHEKHLEEVGSEAFLQVLDQTMVCLEDLNVILDDVEGQEELNTRREALQTFQKNKNVFLKLKWVSGITPAAGGGEKPWQRPKIPQGDLLDTIIAQLKSLQGTKKDQIDTMVDTMCTSLVEKLESSTEEAREYAGGCGKRAVWWRNEDLSDAVDDDDVLETLFKKTATTLQKGNNTQMDVKKTSLDSVFLYFLCLLIPFCQQLLDLKQAAFNLREFMLDMNIEESEKSKDAIKDGGEVKDLIYTSHAELQLIKAAMKGQNKIPSRTKAVQTVFKDVSVKQKTGIHPSLLAWGNKMVE